MASRFAVVTSSYGDDWSDDQLVARRIAGALASRAPVDVLVAGTTVGAAGTHPRKLISVLGLPADSAASSAPALLERLRQSAYAAIVFVGLGAAWTTQVARAVRGRSRLLVVPLLRSLPAVSEPESRATLEDWDGCLALSELERRWIERLLPRHRHDQIHSIGLSLRVHPLAYRLPIRVDDRPSIVAIGDWRHRLPSPRWTAQLETLAAQRPGASVCVVGRAAERLGDMRRAHVARATARLDLWRWVRGADAVIVEDHARCLGRDLLEVMLLGRPVLAPAGGEISRWHLEQSDGGVWFHAYPDLRAAIDYFLEDPQSRRIGVQAQTYAEALVGDADSFTRRVLDAVAPDHEPGAESPRPLLPAATPPARP